MAAKTKKTNAPKSKLRLVEVQDYDQNDTSKNINLKKPLRFEDLGLKLPPTPPTKVVSIRLPSELLNRLQAMASQKDVPYQALIKLFLSQAVDKEAA